MRLCSTFLAMVGCAVICGPISAAPQQAAQIVLATCSIDSEIPASERAAIDQAATKFVQDLTGTNADAAYAAMTPDAKKKMTAQKFTVMAHERIQPAGPFQEIHVARTYLVKVASKGERTTVVCGDPSKPEQMANVAPKMIPRQAYTLVDTKAGGESWAFTLWLIPEQTAWHIQNFQLGAETLGGRSAGDLAKLAKQEEDKHHDFNAYMLYAMALQLSWRGPDLEPNAHMEIQRDMQAVQKPKDLREQPGFNWETHSSAFKVVGMGPVQAEGKLYLRIGQELAPWNNDKEADQKNRELAAAFAKIYPEYREVFGGLVVEAYARGSSLTHRTLIPN